MSTTVTVSIGRNVGDEPMSDERWYDFRSALLDELDLYSGGNIHFQGQGTGIYAGTVEQSFTAVATVENPVGLYHTLAELAHAFDQDSIALTTGNTSFPGSREA
jgi:hypothetical protein